VSKRLRYTFDEIRQLQEMCEERGLSHDEMAAELHRSVSSIASKCHQLRLKRPAKTRSEQA
jgi:DNA-directed RNA polymerase specialized sigma24 family protein